MNRMIAAPFALMVTVGMNAQSAHQEVQAKFIKVLMSSTSQFGFACSDEGMKKKLEEMGISVGPGFKFAWAASVSEVRALKQQNHFIICPNVDWLKDGACIAVVEEGGRPGLYLDVANAKASGVTLSDAILKIAKKI